MRQARLGGLAAVVVAASLVLGATSAAAEEEVPGDWYFDVWGVQESLDAGYDGSGVHVAVIDDQINPEIPTLQGADLTVAPSICHDASGALSPAISDVPALAAHGTNSTSLVVGSGAGFPGQIGVRGAAPGAKVTFYSAGQVDFDDLRHGAACNDESGERITNAVELRIEQALDDGADVITIQLGSGGVDPDVVVRAMREGVIVLQSLENELVLGSTKTSDLAAMNGVVGVQAIDAYGEPQNEDESADVAGPGVDMTAQGGPNEADDWELQTRQSGTSNATPFTAGVIAAAWSKHPEATGNQMIQSLIRNTGVEEHELARDDALGYGIVSLRHMLDEDPMQYDDVNPLIVDDRDVADQNEWQSPRYLEIFPGEAESDPTTVASDDGPPIPGSLVPLLLLAGGLGLLVLAGLVIVIVVLVRRSNRSIR